MHCVALLCVDVGSLQPVHGMQTGSGYVSSKTKCFSGCQLSVA